MAILLNGLQAAAATDRNKRQFQYTMTITKRVTTFSRLVLKLVQTNKT